MMMIVKYLYSTDATEGSVEPLYLISRIESDEAFLTFLYCDIIFSVR